jgi:nucleotide-binding universal stress UspA family protein
MRKYRQLSQQKQKMGAEVGNPPGERPFRRVVVALDASSHSWTALLTAARLAASFGADLEGLFVEDINLLRMAGMPISREVGFFSGSVRQVDSQQMERQLRAVAARIRQMLAQVADQAEVKWLLQVRRGKVAEELIAAASSETDLLSLGRHGWPLGRRSPLGSTARVVLQNHHSPVLLASNEIRGKQPMVVVYDGSEQSNRALDIATHLVWTYESELIVLVPAPTFAEAQQLRERAIERLMREHVHAGFQHIDRVESAELLQILQHIRPGVLVLTHHYFSGLDNLTCAVLLVPEAQRREE